MNDDAMTGSGARKDRDLQAPRVITCIVRNGKGQAIAEHFRRTLGIDSVAYHHARGLGIGIDRQSGFHEEREIVEALVDGANAESAFAEIYYFAELDKPHNGLVFMTRCRRGIPIDLPDLPDEE